MIEVSQPAGQVAAIPPEDDAVPDILDVLEIARADLAAQPIQNAATSRVKTLVPIRDVARLNDLRPDFDRVAALCERLGSTGLYPYAVASMAENRVEARQFPRASGYPEDAATGIAATALAFALWDNGLIGDVTRPVEVVQGRAMGRTSRIVVRFEQSGDGSWPPGCWLSGEVTPRDTASG